VALLLPALAASRDSAQAAECLANVRTLGTGFNAYALDNDGEFIRYDNNAYPTLWPIAIETYVGRHPSKHPDGTRIGYYPITFCPEAPKQYEDSQVPGSLIAGGKDTPWYHWFSGPTRGYYAGSYALNGYLYSAVEPQQNPGGKGFAPNLYKNVGGWPNTIDNIKETSSTPAFCDGNWVDGWPTENDMKPASFKNISGSLNPHMWRYAVDRHHFYQNVGFIDGHAEPVPVEQLWELKWNPAYSY
jgi:hypothetical protein